MNDDPGVFVAGEPADVLDPRHYAGVRAPGSNAALPLWCYTSERFFQAEMQRMLLPGWNLLERIAAAHAAVRHATHAGPHASIGAPSEREVRLVVTMTGALLKYHASP